MAIKAAPAGKKKTYTRSLRAIGILRLIRWINSYPPIDKNVLFSTVKSLRSTLFLVLCFAYSSLSAKADRLL